MKKNTSQDTVFKKIQSLLPKNLNVLKGDLTTLVHDAIKKGIKDCQLVTQEEFDAQAKQLAKTEKKLEQLEQQVQLLKSRFHS